VPVKVSGCALCETDGGPVIFRNEKLRIVQAEEAGFPGFYRVVWNQHVAEFSALDENDRAACMNAVVAVERVLLEVLKPSKINLASLGNMVPHLHWHVIPRFDWDSHYPGSVWASPQRSEDTDMIAHITARCGDINRLIAAKMTS
jgi:diadenosine tetraphosphate (Ap4A) HIT family hydrolase